MLKNAVLPACLIFCMALISCAKEVTYDREAQLKLDVDSIDRFLKLNNINATKDDSGLFSQILNPGEGAVTLDSLDTVTVAYTGRLLNGAVVDNPTLPVRLVYSGLIEGWKRGLPKIQAGGQIRLIIPSVMAYTDRRVGLIPANSNLDYTISLLRIGKLKITK
ncbi:MAG: peptidylprolyl isomerase [Pedobacter sp.]|jgi:FKBP-type peptidyl-prolyl cis-trans isomerase FkpA|nr:peptidylprolyl isomerase [Pedobacter sp.]